MPYIDILPYLEYDILIIWLCYTDHLNADYWSFECQCYTEIIWIPYNDILKKYHINGSKKDMYRAEDSGSREEDDGGTSRDQYGEEDNGGTLVVR